MTFLPIIERELRVRARRRAGYWTRFGVALGGVLICVPQLMISRAFGPPGTFGKAIFDAIVAAAFLLSCSACLLTADAITVEKQEGTLGLLFLTRIKALDVLLGKLGSVGLTSMCSLLAFVPIMMIPILAGGVTGGEAIRKGLALVTMLCLALAAGLWAATSSRKTGAVRNAAGAVLLTVFLPFCIWQFSGHETKGVGVLSPLVALLCAGDAAYRSAAGWYWASLVGGNVLACLLLVAAGVRLRRATEPEAEVAPPHPVTFTLFGKEIVRRVHWESARDEASPVAWLVRRQPGLKPRLWAAAVLALLYQGGSALWTQWFFRATSRSVWSTIWMPSLAISALESALIAWAASRFFVEARRTAELEVLLTTPVGTRTVVADQWKALQRLLVWPFVVMLFPTLIRLLNLMNGLSSISSISMPPGYRLQYAVSLVLSLVSLFLHVGAVCWLAMWFGLKARGQAGAVLWTVGLTTGGPYLVSILSYGVFGILLSNLLGFARSWYFAVVSWLPQVMALGLNLALILWARGRLLRAMAGAAAVRLTLRESFSDAARNTTGAIRKARQWTPS